MKNGNRLQVHLHLKYEIKTRSEGREEVELIGKILLAQKILKRRAYSKKSLAKKA